MWFNILLSITSFEGVSVNRHQCRRKDFNRLLGLETLTFMWASTVVTCTQLVQFRYDVVKTVVTRREPDIHVVRVHFLYRHNSWFEYHLFLFSIFHFFILYWRTTIITRRHELKQIRFFINIMLPNFRNSRTVNSNTKSQI